MRKDGVLEKVVRDLQRIYDDTVKQPIPEDMLRLIAKLK